jgi:hypothetical protein
MTYSLQQIRSMLATQEFAEWYETTYQDYITGEDENLTSADIETALEQLL